MVHLVITSTNETTKEGDSSMESLAVQPNPAYVGGDAKASRDAGGNLIVVADNFNLSLEDVTKMPKVIAKQATMVVTPEKLQFPRSTKNPDEASFDVKKPAVNHVQAPMPCLSFGDADTLTGTYLNPTTFDDEDEDTEEKAVAAMLSTMNHSGSVLIGYATTPQKQIKNPYLSPQCATTTHSKDTPVKQPPTRVEWERAKAFCKSGEESECSKALRRAAYQRAEANRQHALNIQKLRTYEQARQQLPTNNYLSGAPNHQQVASSSIRPCVSNRLHRKHVFTILCAMKHILDWDEEEDHCR